MAQGRAPSPVHYPESDGQPMAESDRHRHEMVGLIDVLTERYRDRPDAYVSGNLFVYHEEGNPRAVFAPDVFVAFGVPDHRRRIFKLWEEQHGPAVVFEITSRSTRREDLRDKRALCARLGIREYFLFDPEGEYLDPPLQGFRLVGGRYLPIEPDEAGAVASSVLGVMLSIDRAAGELRLTDVETGKELLRAAEGRRRAEAEVARLRAELARHRRSDG